MIIQCWQSNFAKFLRLKKPQMFTVLSTLCSQLLQLSHFLSAHLVRRGHVSVSTGNGCLSRMLSVGRGQSLSSWVTCRAEGAWTNCIWSLSSKDQIQKIELRDVSVYVPWCLPHERAWCWQQGSRYIYSKKQRALQR